MGDTTRRRKGTRRGRGQCGQLGRQLDLPQEVLRRLDYVMAGLHVPVMPAFVARCVAHHVRQRRRSIQSDGWRDRARELNTEALIQAVLNNRIDVVTHPGWRLSIDTPALARRLRRRGTALEINTSHVHTDMPYIQAAAAEGVHFVIGSDAHAPATGRRFAIRARNGQTRGLDGGANRQRSRLPRASSGRRARRREVSSWT